MMKKIKIVFNAHGDSKKIGSVRIPMDGFGKEFLKYPDFDVSFNDFNNYKNYDVAILHTDDDEIYIAKQQNKDIIIGLAKPHHERVVHAPFEKFTRKSFLYQLRLIIGDKRSKFIRERTEKLNLCDFLISDSLHLHNMFESCGYDSVYLKLIESFDDSYLTTQYTKKCDEIIFGYHGNYRHFLESKKYIFPALNYLSREKKVVLKVVSNLSEYDFDDSCDFKIEYHEYDFPKVFDVLNGIDIGLVPNHIGYRNVFFEKLFTKFGCFFWKTDKYHDVLFRFKQSSNAGRAFIFSQLKKPFIGCPIPEVVSIFGSTLEEYLPFDENTWKHCIIKLANNYNDRVRISNELEKINSSQINTKIEADKLRLKILGKIDMKKQGEQ